MVITQKFRTLVTEIRNQVRMGGSERFHGQEHDGHNNLVGFIAVWLENRLEVVATYGGLWRFLASVRQWDLVGL